MDNETANEAPNEAQEEELNEQEMLLRQVQ